MTFYDAVIVGAGPAGATLARGLAKEGVDTLLLEKARLPRCKPCAGGVTARAAKLLDFDISPVAEQTVCGGRVSYNLAGKCERSWHSPLIYNVSREKFDALLCGEAVRAGARLTDGSRVESIEKAEAGYRIETSSGSYFSRTLIGADGANSAVARALNLTSGFSYGIGIEAEVFPDDKALAVHGNRIEIDIGTLPAGYGWCFPKKEHLSIGVAGYLSHTKKLRPYLERLVAHYCPGDFEIKSLRGAGMRIRNNRNTPIVAGGALLVGEAAGLVNAFTGEGIYYAIKSAELAAPAVLKYLNGETAGYSEYRRAVDEEIWPELGVSYTVARMALCGGIGASRLFFNSFVSNKRLWRKLAGVLSGELTYAEFRASHPELRPVLSMMRG